MSDDFFGCNLSDEAAFTQAAAQQYAANNVLRNSSIMDSVVGLKAANAHLARRAAELEADKSRRDIVAQNITPAAGLPPLGAEAWFEIAMAYRAEIDDLMRRLAAQALAHAEQMEGNRPAKRVAELTADMKVKARQIEELEAENDALEHALKKLHEDVGFWIEAHGAKKLRVAELESENSRLTLGLAGQNIHAQQTAGDVKAAPERRPDGTLKPVAKTWEAPRRSNDPRMVGR